MSRSGQKQELNLSHVELPTRNGDIDWDIVAADYHRYILGPFAPKMVVSRKDSGPRNLLISYLHNIPIDTLIKSSIVDFGCGPGNLLPSIKGRIEKISGIDKSRTALNIAKNRANRLGIDFEAIEADFETLRLGRNFDIVISVNSILPSSRAGVIRILKQVYDHLSRDGLFLAILPSFDTTQYLRDLWLNHYIHNHLYSESEAEAIGRKLDRAKLVDRNSFSYADDGKTPQCYHTLDTIRVEFSEANLDLPVAPRKVYYPWSLVKEFDYGHFPEAPEEIWDWFVIAKPRK